MKTNLILIIQVLFFILTGCGDGDVFSPDLIRMSANSKTLWVTNRAGNEIRAFHSELKTTDVKAVFDAPVQDILQTSGQQLWVVSGGSNGRLLELNPADLSVISSTTMGHTPSSILFNRNTNTLWVTQRYNGELWEIAPNTKEVLTKIPVGREPLAMVSFAGDTLMLIANNLPEMSSMAYPVACRLDVVNAPRKQVVKRLMLPNGSTDIKSMATDSRHEYAYIVHLLARYQLPTNQVERGWMTTNALSVINLLTCEVENTVLLDTPQRGAANPWTVAVSPDDKTIWISLSGSHELACIDRVQLHNRLNRVKNGEKVTPSTKEWENVPDDAGFLYGIRRFIPTDGKGPRALCVTPEHVYTANYFTGELIRLDTSGKDKISLPTALALISTPQGKGDMYFHDADLCFQRWQSCASCHPNDARIDGLNWDLLNDGAGNPKNTKTLMLSHQTAPCMVTGIRKDAETAVRSGIRFILFSEVDEEIPVAIDTYLKSLQPVPSPHLVNGNLSEAALRGKASFNTHCASCHAGPLYTDRKQYLIDWATSANKNIKMDVPALQEVWRTAPYLYDGCVYTIPDMLKVHGPKQPLPDKEMADLSEYVLSL